MSIAPTALTVSEGLLALGISASAEQVQLLERFAELAEKWNRKFNIVSRKDMDRFVPRHLLDSLSLLPWVHAERCVDLGSGGGLPGIPLAILQPHMQVSLLERSEKKARFLSYAVRELGLANAQVVVMDAKVYRPKLGYRVLVSRAVAPPAKLWALGQHLLADDGRMVLHAAVGSETENLEMPEQVHAQFVGVSVPGLAEPHQLLVLERQQYQTNAGTTS